MVYVDAFFVCEWYILRRATSLDNVDYIGRTLSTMIHRNRNVLDNLYSLNAFSWMRHAFLNYAPRGLYTELFTQGISHPVLHTDIIFRQCYIT